MYIHTSFSHTFSKERTVKDKQSRLKIIQHLIDSQNISNQESLSALLLEEGFTVTQATLSRDLKLLGVVKVRGSDGGYRYSLPAANPLKENQGAYQNDFLRGFLSIELSGNIGVLRTLPGHASSVALALDQMELDTILGCVAGDDTIIIVLAKDVDQELFFQELRDKFPGLEVG
jgi:transcriptional regulator of arginine metabolism